MRPEPVVELLMSVLQTLQGIHNNAIFHRDIKPSSIKNIQHYWKLQVVIFNQIDIMKSSDNYYLIDFGVTKFIEGGTLDMHKP